MLLWAVAAAVVSAAVILLLEPRLRDVVPEGLWEQNYSQKMVPITGGPLLATGFLIGQASLAPFSPSLVASPEHLGLLAAALGLFVSGGVDDLMKRGGARSRGFRGHLAALTRGQLTGGVVKMIGGGMAALLAGAIWEMRLLPAIADGLVVALTANLLNLFDLRPGRAGKVFLILWIPLAIVGWNHPYLPLSAAVGGGSIVWLRSDLREVGMLGDGGSNLLGAVAGSGLALLLPPAGKLLALVCLVALTAASEVISFTKTIERVPPLRWADRLGRVKS